MTNRPLASTDADVRSIMTSACACMVALAAVAAALFWWKLGWQSAVLLAVGALISGSGLFEWLRLMTALMARMDVAEGDAAAAQVRPLAPVLIGFFLRLFAAVAALYVSLNYLHGSVFALAAGLALGAAALLIEGLRLVRSWTT